MLRSLLKGMLPIAVMIIGSAWTASSASAQDYCRPWQPDLFYNYYVSGPPCNGYGAVPGKLYVSPRPTPEFVGHTYITYQPLMPHEFLYKHKRCYFANHCGSGYTMTRVCWW